MDAHFDANTPSTTVSENVHGCPVGYLSGAYKYHKQPVLSLKDIIYFGIRQFEIEEKAFVEKSGIPWLRSEECLVERMGEIKTQIEDHFFPD